MSYTQVDGVWDDIVTKGKTLLNTGKSALNQASGAIAAGKAILEDPYLPEVTTLVMRLKANEEKRGIKVTGKPGKGIGLSGVVTPLRMFVTVRENPVIGLMVLAGIVAIPFVAGYVVGKAGR